MIRLAPTLSLILALLPAPIWALEQEDVLTASLESGWQTESGSQMAALVLNLAPGWKTYWRAPGDAGIPPVFDWSASQNLKSLRLHWPTPTAFEVSGIPTIGYKGGLVLPIEVTATNPAAPIVLHGRIDLGVCDNICMPAHLDLTVTLAGKGAPRADIAQALTERPVPGLKAGLATITCAITPIDDGLGLTATMTLPGGKDHETVVFETTDPTIWVRSAETSREGATLTASTEMVAPSGAPFALDRGGVTLTVLAANQAIEIKGCPAP